MPHAALPGAVTARIQFYRDLTQRAPAVPQRIEKVQDTLLILEHHQRFAVRSEPAPERHRPHAFTAPSLRLQGVPRAAANDLTLVLRKRVDDLAHQAGGGIIIVAAFTCRADDPGATAKRRRCDLKRVFRLCRTLERRRTPF